MISVLTVGGWARRLALPATLCVALSLGYSSVEQVIADSTRAPVEHTIVIKDLVFSPASIEVSSGDTVTWINQDFIPHTATALDGSWTSPSLSQGDTFSLTIQSDTYTSYFCEFHPNMQATLE